MKNILILSCKAGEGHNAAAHAMQERFEHEGHRARVVDYFGLLSEKMSESINSSYVNVAKYIPPLFGAGYHLTVLLSPLFRYLHSPIYAVCAKVAPKLRELLESEHFDAVVAPHVFPILGLTYLKSHGYDVPFTIYVSTDYTCYPFLEEAHHCDIYVMASEKLKSAFLRRHLPEEKLRAYGIPVSMRFLDIPLRAFARKQLGIEVDKNTYLIMGGSMGAGHMRTFAKKLYQNTENAEIIVICGKNEPLQKTLEADFGSTPNVRIVGFTTQIPLYMAACDVLYTKPGGLTSTEALVTRTPIVHTAPIPGCESANYRFFRNNGLSLPAKRVGQQIINGKRLAEDPKRREAMRKAQSACAKPDASLNILKLILENT